MTPRRDMVWRTVGTETIEYREAERLLQQLRRSGKIPKGARCRLVQREGFQRELWWKVQCLVPRSRRAR